VTDRLTALQRIAQREHLSGGEVLAERYREHVPRSGGQP